MSEPYLGEIRIFSFNFPPHGWALCDGQVLPINQNQALFSILGTTYGGDGRTNFALPNLQGRTPVHVGDEVLLGASAGEETHTLNLNEMPVHSHGPQGTPDQATSSTPAGNVPAARPRRGALVYTNSLQAVSVAGALVGSGNPHENMQPCLTLSFAIALQGIFPSRN
jgi:microcystin-dependent protein